jgi:uncharacterized protein
VDAIQMPIDAVGQCVQACLVLLMCFAVLLGSLIAFVSVAAHGPLFVVVAFYGFSHGGLFTVVSPLVGEVRFLRTGPEILVTGSLEGTIEKSCGRCLATFVAPVSIELEEQFYPVVDVATGTPVEAPPDADEANSINSQHVLDLYEVVRQELLLESGSILNCRPDCKGLCPQCGQDRNTDPCTCQDEAIDLRWAGLKALQEASDQ